MKHRQETFWGATTDKTKPQDLIDFEKVTTQHHLRRAVEVSIAGNHKLMIVGRIAEPVHKLEYGVNTLFYKLFGKLYPIDTEAKVRPIFNITFVDLPLCICIAIFERPYCECSPETVNKFRGSLLPSNHKEYDMYIEMDYYSMASQYGSTQKEESTQTLLARIQAVRKLQELRLKATSPKDFLRLDSASSNLLKYAKETLLLEEYQVDKILWVARTIADLATEITIKPSHLAEAIQYQEPLALTEVQACQV